MKRAPKRQGPTIGVSRSLEIAVNEPGHTEIRVRMNRITAQHLAIALRARSGLPVIGFPVSLRSAIPVEQIRRGKR